MKTLFKILSVLIFTPVLFMACQKEVSFERGSSTASVGSLSVDGSGNCLGAVVSGTYFKDTAIKASNYVDVSVQVDTVGTYKVYSDTVNGYYFKATGSFTATGAQTVRLIGGGKPFAAGINIFTVTYNRTVCEFTVTVNAVTVGDYFPRTTNSFWSYMFDNIQSDSIQIFVVAPTRTINGNTYNLFFYDEFGTTTVDTFGYYRKAGADYFEWKDMGTYVGLDDPYWMEYTFLKDNLTTGGTWTSAQFAGASTVQGGTTTNITLRWEFSITGQNIPVTVLGTPFTNVIRVKQELKQQSGTTWLLVAYFDCYYAKDKGLIKQDLYNNTGTKIYAQDVRFFRVY